jgi:hypothetical protein
MRAATIDARGARLPLARNLQGICPSVMKIDAATFERNAQRRERRSDASWFDESEELERRCARSAHVAARGACMRRNAGHRVTERTRS